MLRKNRHGPKRPAFSRADRLFFKRNPEAGFRVRGWTDEDADCGTDAFAGYDLTGSAVLVFRCGARIPAVPLAGGHDGATLTHLLTSLASGSIAIMPEYGAAWPPRS